VWLVLHCCWSLHHHMPDLHATAHQLTGGMSRACLLGVAQQIYACMAVGNCSVLSSCKWRLWWCASPQCTDCQQPAQLHPSESVIAGARPQCVPVHTAIPVHCSHARLDGELSLCAVDCQTLPAAVTLRGPSAAYGGDQPAHQLRSDWSLAQI